MHPAGCDVDADDLDAFLQPGTMAPRGRRVAGCDIGRARDAVARTERAAEDVVDVQHGNHARGFGGIDPPSFG